MEKILVLTSGGDAPGMNAAIRAVVRTGIYRKTEVWACHNGYQGLIKKDIFRLKNEDVAGSIQRGGTILRSSRCELFHEKKERDKIKRFLKQKDINNLIIIGGDGSFRGATTFSNEGGPKSVGIPGTIDNDILGTEYTIGFDTARNTALKAIDNIRDTAFSNSKYFLVEVMGQRAGFLAVDVGIAGGAEFILTPEFPLTTDELAKKIMAPRRKKESLIIVVAEAGKPGRSVRIADKLRKLTPFDYRVCILGHIQRGGSPTVVDREIASRMGNLAVEAILAGESNCMTALKDGHLTLSPFPGEKAHYRKLETDKLLKLSSILAS